jgi:hypothetical protein
MDLPTDLAFRRNGDLMVCSDKTLRILDVNSGKWKSQHDSVPVKGIAVGSDDQVVLRGMDKQVLLLTPELEVFNTLEFEQDPRDIVVDPVTGNIIVLTHSAVSVYSPVGEILHEFGDSTAEGLLYISSARGVGTDGHGIIVVSDQAACQMNFFTIEGVLLRRFGKGLADPTRMAMNQEGDLFIIDWMTRQIRVFG